jgi:hypothetical protein
MQTNCPQCNKPLPEVETLEYRFCPHCGAELAVEPDKLDDVFLTIPPDLPPARADDSLSRLSPPAEQPPPDAGPSDDPTIEPQPLRPQSHPEIRPPSEKPPPGFFREPPAKTPPGPAQPINKPPAKNPKKILIAVLILLAVVILILGGLFTF